LAITKVQKLKGEIKHLKYFIIAYVIFSILFMIIFIAILYYMYAIIMRSASETISFLEWILNLVSGEYSSSTRMGAYFFFSNNLS